MLQLKNITKTYITGDEKVEALKGIEQTCPIMIQRLNNIFQRNPLISMGI